jgi:hypothetical protein
VERGLIVTEIWGGSGGFGERFTDKSQTNEHLSVCTHGAQMRVTMTQVALLSGFSYNIHDRLRGLVATDPEVPVRFPALPDFVRSSGSGTESTQPREYN